MLFWHFDFQSVTLEVDGSSPFWVASYIDIWGRRVQRYSLSSLTFFPAPCSITPSYDRFHNSRKRFALIAQSAERVLGKDEVTSSNLVKSSIEHSENPHGCLPCGFSFGYVLDVKLPISYPLCKGYGKKSRRMCSDCLNQISGASFFFVDLAACFDGGLGFGFASSSCFPMLSFGGVSVFTGSLA